ncbi:putative transcription factor NAM family [Helianthus annuus]|uniref:Putative NAC domain-containing protein n=2 Tax=Helianthus annuus TaxID=4232 RepID=A0A251VRC4_HELAN|nr:putative transcription factor NAM family [Helianthus annuus]KAJ0624127.1 putative transcription factor NAM family [Helianthus annuus]KAJ0627957.1 putative transcription factor NAM family [Helianthus annuus]KAJ0784249.1 putative transcription factor NAM family [Helianthus annuus]KAJ0793457.1 putative transcription factor NAM family [Helianthus annuus]
MDQIVPNMRQEQPDYLDNLPPGYRFCPTDSELILYYLKPKIETGEHPECRIYAVNLYNHSPEELTNQYRACDDKWYFFTPRERKYEKGNVPNRRTGDLGVWKASQKYTLVYHHDATGSRVVGTKRGLGYHDRTGCKTSWLMQEYAMNDPNLPIKSRQDSNKVLTDWVICKIYKKNSTNETKKSIAQAPRQVFASEETGEYQQNHSMATPTNIAQIPHGATASTAITSHVYVAQSRAYASPVLDQIVPQNQSMSNATSSFRYYEVPSNSTSAESLVDAALPFGYTTPVTSEDVAMDEFNTTQSVVDKDMLVIDDWISFDDFMKTY